MKLKKDAEQSLYMQLMFEIKAQIESGYYVAGDKIPTEVELGKIYNVSRITIRKTVEELCKLGYCLFDSYKTILYFRHFTFK